MQDIETGKEKQVAYSTEYKQFQRAIKAGFYLEAIAIGYAIIEDRLAAFFYHTGIAGRDQGKLKIYKRIYPYLRHLLKKDKGEAIQIDNLSVKVQLATEMLALDDTRAQEIDQTVETLLFGGKSRCTERSPGYLQALVQQLKKIDHKEATQVLEAIEPWRTVRNELIHALLHKRVLSVKEAKKICATDCYAITRQLESVLVKPVKRNNHLTEK